MSKIPILALVLLITVSFVASVAGQSNDSDVTLPPWRRELPGGREVASIQVGNTPLDVDLALTWEQQSLGLGYRNGLEPGTGMLFVGQQPRPRSFWMKGMRFCLDIIWIDDIGIAGAAENVCPDPDGTADADRARFSSPGPVVHVLEVPAGWLDDHGYGVGTTVDLRNVPGVP